MVWIIQSCADAVKRLYQWRAGAYRPHRHYMRGPGPASARKAAAARPDDLIAA